MSGTEYPKINGIYKRDTRGAFILGEFSTPEFAFLADKPWRWTEKVDGTNIRLAYEGAASGFRGNEHAWIAGRTDNAQIPPKLLGHLIGEMQRLDFEAVFPDASPDSPVVLYGEGYGAGIQKGGGNYRPDQSFVLFDVKVGIWWLTRESVEDVGGKLGLDVVQDVMTGTVQDAIECVSTNGFVSAWPDVAVPEGLVGRPAVDLFDRRGERIVTKIKHRDFS